MKLKLFLQRILQEIVKKKNKSWNIRRLVVGSFVQTNQHPSVIYYRLTDFFVMSIQKYNFQKY